MVEITKPLQEKLEFIKNPVIAEFLGVKQDTSFTENDLETAILDNVREFLMELGKGYAFVARQQHIHTEKEDYYIDLVFYNYILKCFVLIDLKTSNSTRKIEDARLASAQPSHRAAAPRTGAAVGCEVSRVGRSTVYNRTRDAPVSRNGLALCYNGGMKNAHVVYET